MKNRHSANSKNAPSKYFALTYCDYASIVIMAVVLCSCTHSITSNSEVSDDNEKCRTADFKEISLTLCEGNAVGVEITAVGIDYRDCVTVLAKDTEQQHCQYILPVASFYDFFGQPEGPITITNDLIRDSGTRIEDFDDQFQKLDDKFKRIIGSYDVVFQKHFYRMTAACSTSPENEKFSFMRMLQYIHPSKVLVYDFSSNVAANKMHFLLYDLSSSELLSETSIDTDNSMFATYSSEPFGKDNNYILICERVVNDNPTYSAVRLLQINPLKSIAYEKLPKSHALITSISRPISDSEIKIAISEYPYILSCHLIPKSNDRIDIGVFQDCTPPVQSSCAFVSDFRYYDPWVTWISAEGCYKLNFWSPKSCWYVVDLSPYTVFDDRYCPIYDFSASTSTLVIHQDKVNNSVILFQISFARDGSHSLGNSGTPVRVTGDKSNTVIQGQTVN